MKNRDDKGWTMEGHSYGGGVYPELVKDINPSPTVNVRSWDNGIRVMYKTVNGFIIWGLWKDHAQRGYRGTDGGGMGSTW